MEAGTLLIETYNHPEAGVSLVRLLVKSLVLRHLVLSVDQTVSGLEIMLGSDRNHMGKQIEVAGTEEGAQDEIRYMQKTYPILQMVVEACVKLGD
jgi:hypothetical protein